MTERDDARSMIAFRNDEADRRMTVLSERFRIKLWNWNIRKTLTGIGVDVTGLSALAKVQVQRVK